MEDRFPVKRQELDKYVLKRDFKQAVNSQTVIVTGESGSGTQIIVGSPPDGGGGGGGGSGYWATPGLTATRTISSKDKDIIYQNTNASLRVVMVTVNLAVGDNGVGDINDYAIAVIYSDSNASPSTEVGRVEIEPQLLHDVGDFSATSGLDYWIPITFLVLPNHYYTLTSAVSTNGVVTVDKWTEWDITFSFS